MVNNLVDLEITSLARIERQNPNGRISNALGADSLWGSASPYGATAYPPSSLADKAPAVSKLYHMNSSLEYQTSLKLGRQCPDHGPVVQRCLFVAGMPAKTGMPRGHVLSKKM
ncbi:hypothetical protein E5D57_000262 [Metarhizium anisopliae]|nr:hypothetical protein E5D57_000262 [Metarhizium anisopliae]